VALIPPRTARDVPETFAEFRRRNPVAPSQGGKKLARSPIKQIGLLQNFAA